MTDKDPKSDVDDNGASDLMSGSGAGKEDVVAYDTYSRVLGKVKKTELKLQETNSKYQETRAKLDEYEAAREAKQIEEQKARGEFDKILADKDERIANLESNLNSNIKQTNDFVKTNAFLSTLEGKLETKYFNHIPLDSIKIDESGEIDQESLSSAVSGFKESHPRLIIQRKADIPNTKTGSTGGSLSKQDWKAIRDPAEQRRRYKEVDWS
jgi:hypothetical protein